MEVRSFDSQPDGALTLGLAALVQALAAYVLDGGDVDRPGESVERHNRWSAMEYATRGRFLVPGRDAPVDVTELVHDAVELARPYARALGSEPWLDVIEPAVAEHRALSAIAAFEAGGVRGLLEHCVLSADARDRAAT